MKVINTDCWLHCEKAATIISKLPALKRFRVIFRDNSSFSAIRAADNGFSFQNWNIKTRSWDSLPLNPWLVKQVKFY